MLKVFEKISRCDTAITEKNVTFKKRKSMKLTDINRQLKIDASVS